MKTEDVGVCADKKVSDRYLEVVKRTLMDTLHGSFASEKDRRDIWDGRKFSNRAHTMIGRLRLDALEACCKAVIEDGIPGDFLEAGVWRGGACVLMRAVLEAHGSDWDAQRKVYVCDSFKGLPEPTHPVDADYHKNVERLTGISGLAIPRGEVEDTFRRYDLLDARVRFVEGWFKDTLPALDVEQVAVLRLDGDLYESTMDTLKALEHKVPSGGFVVVDDYWAVPLTKKAVDDYRREKGITDPIQTIDWAGALWRKA